MENTGLRTKEEIQDLLEAARILLKTNMLRYSDEEQVEVVIDTLKWVLNSISTSKVLGVLQDLLQVKTKG
jgi:hypothetical protein